MLITVVKNMFRHKWKSLLAICISFLLILFLFIYLGGLMRNQEELQNLPDTLPVEGKVVNPNGSWGNGLQISPGKVQKLERTEKIKDVVKTADFHIDDSLQSFTEEELGKQNFTVILSSANSMEAFPYIEADTVKLAQETSLDFLFGEEAVCILETGYMKELGLEFGDTYRASLYRKKYEGLVQFYELRYVTDIQMTVVGSYEIDLGSLGNATAPNVIAPLRYIREAFREVDAPYFVHSMRFTLADALNINVFKEEAAEIGFKPRNPQEGMDVVGSALILYDEAFIKTFEQLNENINLMRLFAPLVFTAIALISFLCAFLLMQSRKSELAIMRSLGVSRIGCFLSLLLENLVLSLIGGLIGFLIGIFGIQSGLQSALMILLLFLLLYLLGAAIAVLFLNRFSVMAILTKTDE